MTKTIFGIFGILSVAGSLPRCYNPGMQVVPYRICRKVPVALMQAYADTLWPFLLTWFNFNPSMDK